MVILIAIQIFFLVLDFSAGSFWELLILVHICTGTPLDAPILNMVMVFGYLVPSFWQFWLPFLFPLVSQWKCDWSHWLRLVLLVIIHPLELDMHRGFCVVILRCILLFIFVSIFFSLWHSYVSLFLTLFIIVF